MDTSLQSSESKRTALAWPATLSNLQAALLLSIPFMLMILITRLDFRLIGDESVFHIKIIESFADQWPLVNLVEYRSASTPLSYLLMTAFGKSVGFEIGKLRLLSATATFLAVYIFYGIAKRRNLPYPLLSSFLLLLFPYVFFFGFTIYPAAIGLFFGMWTLSYYLLEDPSSSDLLKGSFLAGLAVLCRQSFLVIPVGMALSEVWQEYRHGVRVPSRQLLTRLSILSIPVLMFVPLMLVWGGYTPPVNRASGGGEWFLQLRPQQLNYMLMVVGFYFLFVLFRLDIPGLLSTKRVGLLIGAALVPVFLLYPVVFEEQPGQTQLVGGFVIRGLDMLRQSLGSVGALLAAFGLWTAGLLILLGGWSIQANDRGRNKLVAIVFVFASLMLISPYVYERYYVLLIPLVILLVQNSRNSRIVIASWLVIQGLIAVGFSYWQIAIK